MLPGVRFTLDTLGKNQHLVTPEALDFLDHLLRYDHQAHCLGFGVSWKRWHANTLDKQCSTPKAM